MDHADAHPGLDARPDPSDLSKFRLNLILNAGVQVGACHRGTSSAMDTAHKSFIQRQKKLNKKHRRLASGYVNRLNENGVIEHRPSRDYLRLTLAPFVILVAFFFAFKALLLTHLGDADYLAHLAALETGNLTEQVGARLMSLDPVTQFLADIAAQLI
ncbi:hypothetical protein SAMN05421853_10130 [Roseivivax halotolerans]|uniref:Uncharacterized protein n=2 Tax=Roseivivax halotolerans TaxID=93684 RepID=A0A1I5UKR5_9RHOB|nr:hypothetical protein SAMN05421853_10130 [Roseivivax halotolerans]